MLDKILTTKIYNMNTVSILKHPFYDMADKESTGE